MTADLRPYPETKDSSLPWLGRVPAHWDIRRNGRLFAQRNETGYGSLPILEVSLRTGVRVRDMDDLKRKQVMSDREKYKRAAKGDIAYNMMRMWQGAVGVAPEDGLVSPAYVVARPYPEAEPRYFCYLFRTDDYKNEVDGFSRGIVKDRNRLYWEDFKRMPSCFPPPDEQKAIADYLDANAAKVRRFIRNRRRLIEVLNEQKQAIINRAVTRGLDPNATLKPSGVDWLGDIPEHWDVFPLKRVCRASALYGANIPASQYADGGVRFLRTTDITEAGDLRKGGVYVPPPLAQGYLLADGDLLISRSGTVGRSLWYRQSLHGDCAYAGYLVRYVPSSKAKPDYIFAFTKTRAFAEFLRNAAIASTIENVNGERFANMPMTVPPIDEQEAIVAQVASDTHPIQAAIGKAEREIDLIHEYRTRLIADVVKGKVDVRGHASPAPLAADEQIDESIDDEGLLEADELELVEEIEE